MPYDDAAEDADMQQEAAQNTDAHQESSSHEISAPNLGTDPTHSAQEETSGGVEGSDYAQLYTGTQKRWK